MAGFAALALGRRWRALALLAAVPAYYLLFQSMLHTEYRYVLPMHALLFVSAGVACEVGRRMAMRLWGPRRITLRAEVPFRAP